MTNTHLMPMCYVHFLSFFNFMPFYFFLFQFTIIFISLCILNARVNQNRDFSSSSLLSTCHEEPGPGPTQLEMWALNYILSATLVLGSQVRGPSPAASRDARWKEAGIRRWARTGSQSLGGRMWASQVASSQQHLLLVLCSGNVMCT